MCEKGRAGGCSSLPLAVYASHASCAIVIPVVVQYLIQVLDSTCEEKNELGGAWPQNSNALNIRRGGRRVTKTL